MNEAAMRTRKNTVEHDIAQADDLYAGHMIKKRGYSRWMISNPHHNNMWTEIIAGEAGSIVVHGDGPNMIFRSWRWIDDAKYLVRWIGSGNLDYIGSKVSCGTATSWQKSLAITELRELIEKGYDHGLVEPAPVGFGELLGRASDDSFPDTRAAMQEAIEEADHDWDGWTPGERPSWDLIAAQAACRRLASLLDAERNENTQ